MQFELDLIKWLQENFFQGIIFALSMAGHLFVVLGFIFIIYTAVNKRFGAKLLVFYFTSMLLNAFLKVFIGRERPYKKGANRFIEQSAEMSMPSGHAQGFTALMSPFVTRAKDKKKTGLIAAGIIVFICFTRLYLGQHYLTDVLAGIGIGLGIAALLEILYFYAKDKAHLYLLALIPITVILLSVFHTDEFRDAFASAGILCGGLIGVFFEQKFVKYEVSGGLKTRALRTLFSLVVTSVGISPTLIIMNRVPMNAYVFLVFFLMTVSFTLLSPFLTKLVFDRKREGEQVPEEAAI